MLPGVKLLSADENEAAELFTIYRYENDFAVIAVRDVGNVLLAPMEAELPVGTEEDFTVLRQPVTCAYIADEARCESVAALTEAALLTGFEADDPALTFAGTPEAMSYAELLRAGCGLAILPETFADARITGSEEENAPVYDALTDEAAATLKNTLEYLGMLGVAPFVDRSADEASEEGRAEWIKVYGLIFGNPEAANEIYEEMTGVPAP